MPPLVTSLCLIRAPIDSVHSTPGRFNIWVCNGGYVFDINVVSLSDNKIVLNHNREGFKRSIRNLIRND